jgi:hypothetical protein
MVYWTHGQIIGGALSIVNCLNFRTRQLEFGAIAQGTGSNQACNFYAEYNGANPCSGNGRSDNTLGESSIVWGNVVLVGHPIFQCDRTSLIVGNVQGTSLTSYYSSGKDYCPYIILYGLHGILGTAGGNITLVFLDPQSSGASVNVVDLSNAHILGNVSLTKSSTSLANARAYALVLGQAQFDTISAGGISASGHISLDLRGAYFTQSTLCVSGVATIDRSSASFTVSTPTTATSVTFAIPFPTGATYTVAISPSSATAHGISSKTATGFTLLLGTGGRTTDVTITRI